jgi:uncharacterized membrane protein
MVDGVSALIAILVLAAVTLATRVGGLVIMSHVTITPRIEVFLKYMATSVLISIVLPAALKGEPRIWLAVAASALIALVTRSVTGAMITGVAVAALGHALGF